MNFLIEYFVSGKAFFAGALMVILAAFMSCWHEKIQMRIITGIFFFIGMVFIIFSGVAIPILLFLVMGLSLATLYFFTPFEAPSTRLFFWGARTLLVLSIFYVFVREVKHLDMPEFEARDHKKMYVIGTDISMNENGRSYVDILRDRYRYNIFNLSEPGNTTKKAISQADLIATDNILILIELGMSEDYAEYSVFLEPLLERLAGKNRTIMMFELPRLSADGNFSQLQRRLAAKYKVKLIPRRVLAAALYTWGNRRRLQLSDSGQLWLAETLAPRLTNSVRKRNSVIAAPVISDSASEPSVPAEPAVRVPAAGAKR